MEKVKENAYPFNSSSPKTKQAASPYIAEVGLYESDALQEWNKKSYNVLFN